MRAIYHNCILHRLEIVKLYHYIGLEPVFIAWNEILIISRPTEIEIFHKYPPTFTFLFKSKQTNATTSINILTDPKYVVVF